MYDFYAVFALFIPKHLPCLHVLRWWPAWLRRTVKLPKETFGSSHQRERKVGWSAFGNQREVQCLKLPLTILQSPHIQSSPIGSSIAAQFESSAICGHTTVSFLSYTCLRTEKKQKMKQHVEKEALHSNCKAPHNLRSAWEYIPSLMNCLHKAG